MKNKLSVLLIVLCLFINCKTYSQIFATVDTRILLILHPSMICYDYNYQAFFRDQTPQKNFFDTLKKVQDAKAKAEKENEIINKEIDQLDKECNKISIELLREKETFAPGDITRYKREREALKSALTEQKKQKVENQNQIKLQQDKIQTMEHKIAELDSVLNNRANRVPNEENIKKYNELLERLYNKIGELELKKLDNLDKAMSELYLTPKETKERLNKISEEIKNIINEVAEKENCSLVIDNSFSIRNPNNKKENVIVADNLQPDVVSSSLFHSFNYFDLEPNEEDSSGIVIGSNMSKEKFIEHLTIGRSVALESNLKQYLFYKDYVPEKVANFTFGHLFLSGGKDITSKCAEQLFKKYNIPEYTRQRFEPVLVEYINGNKELSKGVYKYGY